MDDSDFYRTDLSPCCFAHQGLADLEEAEERIKEAKKQKEKEDEEKRQREKEEEDEV